MVDSIVNSIDENARLRSRYAKSHAISSTEAREGNIFRFLSALAFCGVTNAHMLGLLYEYHGAAIWLTIDRTPQVVTGEIRMQRRRDTKVIRREGRLRVILRRPGEMNMSRRRNTNVVSAQHIQHSSKYTSAMFDLTS